MSPSFPVSLSNWLKSNVNLIPPNCSPPDCVHGIHIWFTVKFLNFQTSKNFAVIYLKLKQRGPNIRVFSQKDANGIANSEDPDQTAPGGAV